MRWIFNYKKATAEQWRKFSEATTKFSTDNHLDKFTVESGYDALCYQIQFFRHYFTIIIPYMQLGC